MTLEEIIAQLEQIESLSRDDLVTLRDAIVELYDEVRAGDLTDEDLAALEELNAARETVVTRIASVDAESSQREDRLAELDAAMHAEDDEPVDENGDGDPGDGDEAPDGDAEETPDDGDEPAADDGDAADDTAETDDRELVLASTGLSRNARRRLGQVARHQPSSARGRVAPLGADVVLAAPDVPGFTPGARVTTSEEFGRAFDERRRAVSSFRANTGSGMLKYPVLQVRREFAADVIIPERHTAEQADEVMRRAVDRHLAAIDSNVAAMRPDDRVVLAAGGPCAPADVDYNVEFIGSNARPFTAAFPTARYPRGRVTFFPPFCFDDAFDPGDELGRIITQAQDEAGYGTGGGLTAPKGCVRIDCPTEETCALDIVIQCTTIGNWVDRAFPEYVRAWRQGVDVVYARRYEEKHMAEVVAGSTVLTGADPTFDGLLDFTGQVLAVVAYTNSCRRLPANQQWHLSIPTWAVTLFKIGVMRYLNLVSNGVQALGVSDAQIIGLLRGMGVNLSTYLDESGPTTQGDDQLLACLTAGAIPTLPTSLRAFLYPEGAWVRGDGGTLDIGVIRDSSLVAANDFQTFSEEWTKMCFRGCDSFVLDVPVCPSGLTAGTVVADCTPVV